MLRVWNVCEKKKSAESEENSRNPNFCITGIVVPTIRILLLRRFSTPVFRCRWHVRERHVTTVDSVEFRARHEDDITRVKKGKKKKEITIFGEFGSMFAFHAVFFQAANCDDRGGALCNCTQLLCKQTRYTVAARHFDCYQILRWGNKQTNKWSNNRTLVIALIEIEISWSS